MYKAASRALLCALLLTAASAASASEDAVRKAMNAFIGKPVVENVRKTPYAGLYEVQLDSGELIYTDEKVGFIIDGRIIDTERRIDVTEQRRNELMAIDFSILPLENAIKQVRGDGSRIIASFEDPNCGYCKRLWSELERLDNITVYTFLYPLLGEDSYVKARNIWCAKDRAAAWNAWMLDNRQPPSASCDLAAVEANVKLGRSLRVQGTPTLFFADGRRVGGFLRGDQLEQVFSEIK